MCNPPGPIRHEGLLPWCAALLIALAGLSTGCSVSSFTTARTVPKGESRFFVAPSMLSVAVSGEPQRIPFVEIGTRYGLTDRVDVGARIGLGLQLDAKVRLAGAATLTDGGFTISLAPGIGYIGGLSGTPTGADGDDLHFFGATIPVLMDYRFTETLTVTLGPRLVYLLQTVESTDGVATNIFGAGATLAVRWQALPGLALVPEVGFTTPFFSALTGVGSVTGSSGSRILQLGLGFVLGGG